MISRYVFVGYPELYGIIWEVLGQQDVQVMNSSWHLTQGDVELIHMAFAAAYHIGDAMVCARGNALQGQQGDQRAIYPACFGEWIISVGAFRDNGYKANYSHYGNGMDFLAPGGQASIENEGIYSTVTYGNGYDWKAGTSMAAPHVTGIVALLHDHTGFVLSDDFETLLIKSCFDRGDPGYDPIYGWGWVNANDALELVTFPNEIFAYQEADAEPYLHSHFGPFTMRCVGWPGLYTGDYQVEAYRYFADIIFADDLPKLFSSPPIVWGTGLLTNGIAWEEPNYYVPYCYAYEGSVTPDGALLETWLFKVQVNGEWQWFPQDPANLTFYYSAVGNASPAKPTGVSVIASQDYHPLIQWNQNTEADLDGYRIYRHVRDWENDWSQIGDVEAGANSFIDYEYTTGHPGIGGPWSYADYRVSAYDLAGTDSKKSDSVEIKVLTPDKPWPEIPKAADDLADTPIPDTYQVLAVYPNPFNAQVKIEYGLPKQSDVNIEIFNVVGQKVATIVSQLKQAGYHDVTWHASDIPSGIYLCKIQMADIFETRRLVLMK
jgi:hypothetical protein